MRRGGMRMILCRCCGRGGEGGKGVEGLEVCYVTNPLLEIQYSKKLGWESPIRARTCVPLLYSLYKDPFTNF